LTVVLIIHILCVYIIYILYVMQMVKGSQGRFEASEYVCLLLDECSCVVWIVLLKLQYW